MNIAIQLDIPKERVRSVLSSYYMSTLPQEYRAADHISFLQADVALARQILRTDEFDSTGVFAQAQVLQPDVASRETADCRQKLRRIDSINPWKTKVTRWLVNYCQHFINFGPALQS